MSSEEWPRDPADRVRWQPLPSGRAPSSSPSPGGRFDGEGTGDRGRSDAGYGRRMPEISRFFGIVITMHFADHDPPHFHARYGESNERITIAAPEVMSGSLPTRALARVIAWATIHRLELEEDWDRRPARSRSSRSSRFDSIAACSRCALCRRWKAGGCD